MRARAGGGHTRVGRCDRGIVVACGKSLPRVMLVASSCGPGGPVVPGSSLSASRSSAGAVAGSDSGSCVAGALEEEVGSLLVSPSVSVFDCDTAGSVSGTGSRPGS